MERELILFDLGGVVVDVESDRLIHQIALLVGRSFEEAQEAIYHEELLLPFELGSISPQKYYEGLKAKLKLPWEYGQFVRFWNSIFRENKHVTDLIPRLAKRHKLMVLSNTNILHLEHIKETITSLSAFSDWIASCEVGLRKPDPQIYRLALERAGVKAHAAVYIDDRPELVEAGRSTGLAAIRFENVQRLEEDLRSIGINV